MNKQTNYINLLAAEKNAQTTWWLDLLESVKEPRGFPAADPAITEKVVAAAIEVANSRIARRVLSAPVPAITSRIIAAAMKAAPNVVVTKTQVAPAAKVRSSVPALKAHKTRLEQKVIGTRGNVRKELVAKIRAYEERISTAA